MDKNEFNPVDDLIRDYDEEPDEEYDENYDYENEEHYEDEE